MSPGDEKERLRATARTRRAAAAEALGAAAGEALKAHFLAVRATMGVPLAPDPVWRASKVEKGVVQEMASKRRSSVEVSTDFPFAPFPNSTAKHASAFEPVIP